jgi:hypothetical protein
LLRAGGNVIVSGIWAQKLAVESVLTWVAAV